jgi:ribosomal protein S18 acetylase RimI-like enzyme
VREYSIPVEDVLENYHPRPCIYAQDKYSIIDLLRTYRVETSVTVYPTTWRVRLLLTSRVWNPEQDVCIWETPSGQMAAFAMLWRRRATSPYLALDRFIHPSFAYSGLASDMLNWGSQRAEAIVAGQAIPLTVYAQDFPPQFHLDNRYESHGFAPMDANPEEYNVYFSRSLTVGLPAPILPPGYAIRPVQGMQELKAYQAMYSFATVNPEHQQALFDSDEYSHLVVVDANGRLAAYCESSFDRLEWLDSGQRIGWIDYIETRPEQQGLGLGQAVMWAGLGRLQECGAETAMLVTLSSNAAANRLYARTGFKRMENLEPPRYEKRIGEGG